MLESTHRIFEIKSDYPEFSIIYKAKVENSFIRMHRLGLDWTPYLDAEFRDDKITQIRIKLFDTYGEALDKIRRLIDLDNNI